MTEIEVRLGAILRHEDFAVLERRHRAWIHVQIRIELHHRDAKTARNEQSAEPRRGDTLAK